MRKVGPAWSGVGLGFGYETRVAADVRFRVQTGERFLFVAACLARSRLAIAGARTVRAIAVAGIRARTGAGAGRGFG
jgi:hypothetical protein